MIKVLLSFSEEQTNQPITAHIILEQGIAINILRAQVGKEGGQIVIEVAEEYAEKIIKAFKDKGVSTIVKHIEIDEDKCIDCGACYSICPSDAIRFDENYKILFDIEKCILCRMCLDVCPTRAIKL